MSSAFGRFLTSVNYQSIAIAAPTMLFGCSLPLGPRTDAEEVNPSCNCPSRDRYSFTFDLSSSGLHLANIVGLISPRCKIMITLIKDANAKARDVRLVSGPWCLPDKVIVCSLTFVKLCGQPSIIDRCVPGYCNLKRPFRLASLSRCLDPCCGHVNERPSLGQLRIFAVPCTSHPQHRIIQCLYSLGHRYLDVPTALSSAMYIDMAIDCSIVC